jgi:hypothetical protein
MTRRSNWVNSIANETAAYFSPVLQIVAYSASPLLFHVQASS